MKKVVFILLVSCGFIFNHSVEAKGSDWVSCEPDYVKTVRLKSNGDLIYNLSEGRRRLALKKADSAKGQMMMNLLLTAIKEKYYVEALYPSGYNCDKDDFSIEARWISVSNPLK